MHLKLFAISEAESSTLRFCTSVFFHITILFGYRLCGWTTIPTTGHWAYIYCCFNYHYIPRGRESQLYYCDTFLHITLRMIVTNSNVPIHKWMLSWTILILLRILLIYDWLYNVVLLHDSWALLKLIPYINDNSTTATCIISLYIKENIG